MIIRMNDKINRTGDDHRVDDKDGGEIWCKLTGLFFRFLYGQTGIDVAIHFHTAKRFNIDCSYNA